MFIRRHLPWVGILVSLVSILIFGLIGFGIQPQPSAEDCKRAFCEGTGLGLVFVVGYALVVAIISTGIGFIIKSVYRKRIWKPGEIIQQKGKIPSLLLMGAIFVFMVYFVLIISGVMYRLAGPGTPAYP